MLVADAEVFAEAEFGGLRGGFAEFVNDIAQELRRIIGAEKLRQRINLESPGAERLKPDACAGERIEMLRQPVSVLGSDFERDGEQQSLRRDALTFHAAFHFLEKNPLMRGVLIHEHKARSVFHEDIKFSKNAEQFEILGWRWRRLLDFGRRRRVRDLLRCGRLWRAAGKS